MIQALKQRLKDLQEEYQQINILRAENVKEKKVLREQIRKMGVK